MSYINGEIEIAKAVGTSEYLDLTVNIARNDWGILNTGNSQQYAILKPGPEPAPLRFITPLVYVIEWHTVIEVWQRFEDDNTPLILFAIVNEVISVLQNDKTLGLSYVQNSQITSITAPSFRWEENGPAWIVQEINVRWLEQIQASFTS